MADLDLNRLLRGGMDLAAAFGRGDDAYNSALAKRAQTEGLLLDARNKRDAAMARDELSGLLMDSGDPADRQRALAIRSGVNPKLLGDLFSGALPNEVRTFQMMTDGLSKEDREQARRINLGLDGRASGAALKYEQVVGPDGVPRYMAFDPNAPVAQQVMTGGYSGFSTPQGRQPVQQQSWAQPGAIYQTPQGISRIDPNIDPAALSLVQADMVGGGAADNYQLPPRDVTPQQFYGGQGGAPVVGRRKEDEARAVKAAELQTQLDFASAEAKAGANAELLKARAKSQADRDATVAGKTAEANRTISLLDEAEQWLPISTGSRVGAAYDAAAGAVGHATEGAKAIAALQTIAGQLTASMPRMEGPQSDKDVVLYKQMAGDLANPALPVEVRQAALEQIRQLNQKYIQGSTRRRRYNPATGRIE